MRSNANKNLVQPRIFHSGKRRGQLDHRLSVRVAAVSKGDAGGVGLYKMIDGYLLTEYSQHGVSDIENLRVLISSPTGSDGSAKSDSARRQPDDPRCVA